MTLSPAQFLGIYSPETPKVVSNNTDVWREYRSREVSDLLTNPFDTYISNTRYDIPERLFTLSEWAEKFKKPPQELRNILYNANGFKNFSMGIGKDMYRTDRADPKYGFTEKGIRLILGIDKPEKEEDNDTII